LVLDTKFKPNNVVCYLGEECKLALEKLSFSGFVYERHKLYRTVDPYCDKSLPQKFLVCRVRSLYMWDFKKYGEWIEDYFKKIDFRKEPIAFDDSTDNSCRSLLTNEPLRRFHTMQHNGHLHTR